MLRPTRRKSALSLFLPRLSYGSPSAVCTVCDLRSTDTASVSRMSTVRYGLSATRKLKAMLLGREARLQPGKQRLELLIVALIEQRHPGFAASLRAQCSPAKLPPPATTCLVLLCSSSADGVLAVAHCTDKGATHTTRVKRWINGIAVHNCLICNFFDRITTELWPTTLLVRRRVSAVHISFNRSSIDNLFFTRRYS
jgi:hypothetical protein